MWFHHNPCSHLVNKAISVLGLGLRPLSRRKKIDSSQNPHDMDLGSGIWTCGSGHKVGLGRSHTFHRVIGPWFLNIIPQYCCSYGQGVGLNAFYQRPQLGLQQRESSPWISPNKPSGHQSQTQVVKTKEVCFESGVSIKAVISQKPGWWWSTEQPRDTAAQGRTASEGQTHLECSLWWSRFTESQI